MVFEKATKKKAKLRMAIFGPSGGGKTFSALRMATGIGGTIAVIDTEYGSASKYADRFEFDVCELRDGQSIDAYVSALATAAEGGYAVVVIDSMTHGWQELLQEVEKLAKTKYRGNTWSAWSEGTPKQKSFVKAIQSYPGHVIATIRSKTAWDQQKDERSGKSKPVRIGLAPEQGKGIEYEFDLLMEISPEHIATVIKDRTGKFQDQIIEKPGEDFGKAMAEWLSDGADAPKPPAAPAADPAKPATRATAFLNGEDGTPKPRDWFHDAIDVLSERDLKGWELAALQYESIRTQIRECGGAKSVPAARELIRGRVQLAFNNSDNPDGEINVSLKEEAA